MTRDFVALDFETANENFASICQVGIVVFVNGLPVESFSSLINPKTYFAGINVSIHGINEEKVKGAPTFREVHAKIASYLTGKVVISHSTFDRSVLRQAEAAENDEDVMIDRAIFALQAEDDDAEYDEAVNAAEATVKLTPIECQWLDTTRVVRRTWTEFAYSGYGLGNMCDVLDIKIRHHDAAQDALATGLVLLHAIAKTGVTLTEWLTKAHNPFCPNTKQDGNPAGPLYGESVVFTGAMSISRYMASDMATKLGMTVLPNVSKHCTMLVVGDQDIKRLAGHTKSSKHRAAEAAITAGKKIRIVGETDFFAICN